MGSGHIYLVVHYLICHWNRTCSDWLMTSPVHCPLITQLCCTPFFSFYFTCSYIHTSVHLACPTGEPGHPGERDSSAVSTHSAAAEAAAAAVSLIGWSGTTALAWIIADACSSFIHPHPPNDIIYKFYPICAVYSVYVLWSLVFSIIAILLHYIFDWSHVLAVLFTYVCAYLCIGNIIYSCNIICIHSINNHACVYTHTHAVCVGVRV